MAEKVTSKLYGFERQVLRNAPGRRNVAGESVEDSVANFAEPLSISEHQDRDKQEATEGGSQRTVASNAGT